MAPGALLSFKSSLPAYRGGRTRGKRALSQRYAPQPFGLGGLNPLAWEDRRARTTQKTVSSSARGEGPSLRCTGLPFPDVGLESRTACFINHVSHLRIDSIPAICMHANEAPNEITCQHPPRVLQKPGSISKSGKHACPGSSISTRKQMIPALPSQEGFSSLELPRTLAPNRLGDRLTAAR